MAAPVWELAISYWGNQRILPVAGTPAAPPLPALRMQKRCHCRPDSTSGSIRSRRVKVMAPEATELACPSLLPPEMDSPSTTTRSNKQQ